MQTLCPELVLLTVFYLVHTRFETSTEQYSQCWRGETHPLLDELEGPLVFGHLEQLHGSPLIGSEATHLADHVPHKLAVLGQTLQANNKNKFNINT